MGRELCWGVGTDQDAQRTWSLRLGASIFWQGWRQAFCSSDRPSTFRTGDHKWAALPAADGEGCRAGFSEKVLWKLRPEG